MKQNFLILRTYLLSPWGQRSIKWFFFYVGSYSWWAWAGLSKNSYLHQLRTLIKYLLSLRLFLEGTDSKKAVLACRFGLSAKLIKVLNKCQSFLRIHSSNGGITVGIEHHFAVFGNNKLGGLNVVSALFPPCTDRVTVGSSHSVCKWIAQPCGNISEFLFRIDRTCDDGDSLLFERSTALFKAS